MFLNDNFLLNTQTAKNLFHRKAAGLPIIDYHCHLDPKEIYEDQNFENITRAWLGGDHYKWRLMRANGINEELITGGGYDFDKFMAWAATVEKALGNPVYTWSHLELKRYFGIDKVLCRDTAAEIYYSANRILLGPDFSRRSLIAKSKVKVVCTTDDPADDLRYHKKLAREEGRFSVYPTYRPDKYLNIQGKNYDDIVRRLEDASGIIINEYTDLLKALQSRLEFFCECGCKLSDHSLDNFVYRQGGKTRPETVFKKALAGEEVSAEEVQVFCTETLIQLIGMYNSKGMVMQLHCQAYRNSNTGLFNTLGPDTGFDCVNDAGIVQSIQQLLNRAEADGALCKTVIYTLNPADLMPLCCLIGCFQKDSPGKMQLGSAWWFADTYSGIKHQLTTLSENGVLGNFVGMLTDSRSFLSYTRHEYFRRILCSHIGDMVMRGEAPEDEKYLGSIVEDICYNNAKTYFGFP